MARSCEMIIGYLLPRQCEEKAVIECSKCGRSVCEHHARIGDQGVLCRDCFEQRAPRGPESINVPLSGVVRRAIYRHEDFSLFEGDEGLDDAFSTLS